jgi:hypothetical protein
MNSNQRFGPVLRRYCLCVTYYLWAFSFSDIERASRVRALKTSVRRDFLGAVKPYVEEIGAALEDSACSEEERHLLEDFAATYEAVLDYSEVSLERVEANWDSYQISHDARLNRSLFDLLRGLDYLDQGNLRDAERVLLRGWAKMVEIERRRALPMPLRQLLTSNEERVGRFEAECREASLAPESAESLESPKSEFLRGADAPPILPSVQDLMVARKQGLMPGFKDLETSSLPDLPQSTGLIIDLDGTSQASSAPPSPVPEEDALLSIPLRGYRPLPSSEEAAAAMLGFSKSTEPEGTSPPVDSLPPVHGQENPWAEISSDPHISSTEIHDLAIEKSREELFPNLDPASDPEAGLRTHQEAEASAATHPGEAESSDSQAQIPPGEEEVTRAPECNRIREAKQHSELAELFDVD